MAESEREYIREKSLEGQASARERGRHGGRPKVFDDDMTTYARTLRTGGVPVPESRKLFIPSGKNKGEHPSSPPSTVSSQRTNRRPDSRPRFQDHLLIPFRLYLG